MPKRNTDQELYGIRRSFDANPGEKEEYNHAVLNITQRELARLDQVHPVLSDAG